MSLGVLDILGLFPPFGSQVQSGGGSVSTPHGFDILDINDVWIPFASTSTTTQTIGRPYFKNNASTTLAQDYDPTINTTITVRTGTGLRFGSPTPSLWIGLTIFRGRTPLTILKCTARTGDTLTVAGAIDGYSLVPLRANDTVQNFIWAGLLDDLYNRINALT